MFEKLDELGKSIDRLGGELHDVELWSVETLEQLSSRLMDLKLKIHKYIEMVDTVIIVKTNLKSKAMRR